MRNGQRMMKCLDVGLIFSAKKQNGKQCLAREKGEKIRRIKEKIKEMEKENVPTLISESDATYASWTNSWIHLSVPYYPSRKVVDSAKLHLLSRFPTGDSS